MNLDLILQKHARTIPSKLAVGWESGSYTYKQLNDEIQKLAIYFCISGVESGDRIAIILANCPEFIISYYACMRVGAISVPINPALTPREFGITLNDSMPKIIITDEKVKESLLNTRIEGKPLYIMVNNKNSFSDILHNGMAESTIITKRIEESSIIYTSGTMGLPKGAVLTHNNLYHNAKTYAEAFDMDENEKTLIVAPLFHTAAQTCCLNSTIYSGGYSCLLPRWESSSKTLSTMEEEEITFFFGPPTMYTYMLNDPNIKSYNLKLRIAFSGAAPLPEEIFNKWRDTFGFEIVEGYGLSETSPVVTFNPPKGRKKSGSIGLPMQDIRVKIVNELLEEVQIDESGELLVQGPNVMKGYWNRAEENELAFVNGWFKTGDIAKRDSEGYLYIIDRKKDIIIRSGFNVYPREIEEVFYQHPAVLEVAVIGYPDADKGELVKAIITLKSGDYKNIHEELGAYCRQNLATYKVPQIIEIVKELPKTSSGKILKIKLREQLTG
ncbi:AMP-binding protein [Bacillus sp. FJAT-29937]|uniref:AMP-binding protein n=1 Tax=Bacillus sp. FJAT-29937 TaxID=1720553 RepID=UPI00082B11CD|nr:AMP-binding protein [Bacillus sp. FJAT-29937]